MNEPEANPSIPKPAPVPAPEPPGARADGGANGRLGVLTTILTAILAGQLGLAWIQGRMLNRQHAQLVEMREDLQGLAEAIESSYGDQGAEEGSLAPAGTHHRHRPRPSRAHPRLARYRIQEPAEQPEQDPAAKELEAVRQSQEKAVKEGKAAQKKLSIREAAERAERVEKIDKSSKVFMWASLGSAVLLFAAFAARGFIRKQRG